MAGRPSLYHSADERPIPVSLRIPHELHEEAQQYIRLHRMTLTELLLEGLRLRLENPIDPRELLASDNSNTVIQELEERVEGQIRAVREQLAGLMMRLETALAQMGSATTMQASKGEARHTQQGLLQDSSNTVIQKGEPQTDIPPYDETKFYLRALCPRKHEYGRSGQSLYRRNGKYCHECGKEHSRASKASRKAATATALGE